MLHLLLQEGVPLAEGFVLFQQRLANTSRQLQIPLFLNWGTQSDPIFFLFSSDSQSNNSLVRVNLESLRLSETCYILQNPGSWRNIMAITSSSQQLQSLKNVWEHHQDCGWYFCNHELFWYTERPTSQYVGHALHQKIPPLYFLFLNDCCYPSSHFPRLTSSRRRVTASMSLYVLVIWPTRSAHRTVGTEE